MRPPAVVCKLKVCELLCLDCFRIELLIHFDIGFGRWKQEGGWLFGIVCDSSKMHEGIEWAR